MKKLIYKNLKSLLLTIVAMLIVFGASSSALAQKSWNDKTPKPDFTAMEEYYEIVDYEYDFTGGGVPRFYLTAKKKIKKTPHAWIIIWRDAKGIKIDQATIHFNWNETQEAAVGEPIRGDSPAPFKRQMSDIKSVVITEKL